MDRTADSTRPHDPGLLAAYAEGRLDDEERRGFTAHLAECSDCRQVLAMLARAPGVRPSAAARRTVTAPVWLSLAATVVLVTLAVRSADRPPATPVASVPEPATMTATAPSAPPPVAPAVVEPTSRATVPVDDPLLDPGLLVKRGAGQRQVGGKTFRLQAGEWVDAALDARASRPTTLIQGPDERAAAIRRLPALAPYAGLGDRVTVVIEGTVYRFAP